MKSFQHLSTLCPHYGILHGNVHKIHVCQLPFRGLSRSRKRTQAKKEPTFLAVLKFSITFVRFLFQYFVNFGHHFAIALVVDRKELIYSLERRFFLRFQLFIVSIKIDFCVKIVFFLAIFAKFRNNQNFFIFFVQNP